jgi:hypothetical protein
MRAGLLALLLLASCAGPRSAGPATAGESASGGLQIRSGLDPASPDPIEGGLGLFSVSVRNGSKKCVILRDLTLVDGTPILTWVNPPPRPLEYDRGSDEFRSEVGPRSAGEVVHIGMLLPGESVIFRPQVRLLNLPRRYLLNYYSYSADQVSQNVYFEVPGPGQLRYRRLSVADVTAIPIMKDAAATHRSVIFPYAHSPTESPLTAELVLDVETPPRKFRLADALRRESIAAADVEESTYCAYLESWAIRTRDAGWLISSKGRSPLPRISRFELCFFHLDTIETHLPAQFEFTGALDVRFQGREVLTLRDTQGRARKLVFIEREKVPAFFREVAEKGLEVDVRAEGQSMSMLLRAATHGGTHTISFADALRKAGIGTKEVVEHRWSEALGAWALRTKSAAWYLSDRASGRLPAISWFSWFFERLDELAAAGDVKFVIPAGETDAFPYAPGGAVRKADLPRFLTAVHEVGLSIDVERSGKDATFRLRR